MKAKSFLALVIAAVATSIANAQIALFNFGPLYTQNFDSLISSGSATSLGITGWSYFESGTPSTSTYAADAGGTATSSVYSYGSSGSGERALGSNLSLAGATLIFGAQFSNTGLQPMTFLKEFMYRAEQWRRGGTLTDRLDFQISTDATSLTTGTWVDFDAWDFISLQNSGTATSLDGNAVANRTTVDGGVAGGGTLQLPSPVAAGGTFWMRWVDFNVSGVTAEHGLAIDNFQVRGIPEPSTFALCGVVLGFTGLGLFRRRKVA
jgi:hypothetical protein